MKYSFTATDTNGTKSYTAIVYGCPFVAIDSNGSFTVMAWSASDNGFRAFGHCRKDKRTGNPRQSDLDRVIATWIHFHEA